MAVPLADATGDPMPPIVVVAAGRREGVVLSSPSHPPPRPLRWTACRQRQDGRVRPGLSSLFLARWWLSHDGRRGRYLSRICPSSKENLSLCRGAGRRGTGVSRPLYYPSKGEAPDYLVPPSVTFSSYGWTGRWRREEEKKKRAPGRWKGRRRSVEAFRPLFSTIAALL